MSIHGDTPAAGQPPVPTSGPPTAGQPPPTTAGPPIAPGLEPMPPSDEGAKKKGGKLEALTKHWLPFFTALMVLVTALVGLYAKTTTDERDDLEASATSLEDRVAELSTDNEELSTANDDLDQANRDLEDENTELREANTNRATTTTTTDSGGGATPPTTSGSAGTSTPVVLRETAGSPVVVPDYDGIDLDSLESNWGIEGSGQDVYVGNAARTLTVSDILSIVQAPPTPDACEAQTIREDYLTAAQTVVGQQLCVRTSEGRWAYVRIAAIDAAAETMSFDITVWKLPTDP